MAADIDLANQALVHIGAAPITSLTENSLAARLVNLSFWDVADDLQYEHSWNFNKFRSAVLAANADAPPFDWTYRYALPTDPWCLRVLRTNEDEDGEKWSVEGRYIASDASSLRVFYLGRVTDIGAWSPAFKTAYVYHLAKRVAYPLTKSVNVARDMAEMAMVETRRARTLNGLESPSRAITSSLLVRART